MPLYPKSRKARRRLTVLLVAAPILALAVGLSLYAMRDAVVFFYGPSDAKTKHLPAGQFQATQILAKHDERYMPKEVVQALKKSGEWRPNGQVASAPAPGAS